MNNNDITFIMLLEMFFCFLIKSNYIHWVKEIVYILMKIICFLDMSVYLSTLSELFLIFFFSN